jgi:hypothetical protein
VGSDIYESRANRISYLQSTGRKGFWAGRLCGLELALRGVSAYVAMRDASRQKFRIGTVVRNITDDEEDGRDIQTRRCRSV